MASHSQSSTSRPDRASAVALQGAEADARPRVVAKGKGALAEQILEIAFANGVRVREDADLVEILDAVDVDCEIPVAALAAVAEILTYVYRENGVIVAAQSHAHQAAKPQ